MQQWILFFIVMDAIIVAIVIWWLTTRRLARARMVPGPTLEALARFTAEIEPQVREYMAATYDGDPGTLPRALPGLVERVASRARAAGIDLGRETLEAVIARALGTLRIARERDVQRAFQDMRGVNAADCGPVAAAAAAATRRRAAAGRASRCDAGRRAPGARASAPRTPPP